MTSCNFFRLLILAYSCSAFYFTFIMKRLQNRIAESRYALPITAIYTVAVWMTGGLAEHDRYMQLAIVAISTYLMVTLNNRNALIRIYSRMVSCSFLALNTMLIFLYTSLQGCITQLCFIMFLLFMFMAYQDKKAPGLAYYAFLCLGIASTQFIQIVFYVPVIWILMASNLMAMSSRMFIASLLGLITPYWFIAVYCAYTQEMDMLTAHITGITEFQKPLMFNGLSTEMTVSLAYIIILAVTGIVHYMRNSYMDKIRTRMIYEFVVSITVSTILFVLLQPQHIYALTGILTTCTSILIAHYIALTRTRLTNISFLIIIIITLVITFINIYGDIS